MPFDGLPAGWCEDLVRLRVALEGVRSGRWTEGRIGIGPHATEHCAIGWLLVATDWDTTAATRLALDYVYPALPPTSKVYETRMEAIYRYNDDGGPKRIVRLFTEALKLAEQRAAR